VRGDSAVAYDEDDQKAAVAHDVRQDSVREILLFHFRAAHRARVFENAVITNN
jgi:hypothetical protein